MIPRNQYFFELLDGNFCRALYDYEATGPEELSFYEGQIIRIIRFVSLKINLLYCFIVWVEFKMS